VTNAVLWARLFERYRAEVMGGRLLVVEGRVQKSPEGVVHLMAARVFDRSADLGRLSMIHRTEVALSRADEFVHPQVPRGGHPRNVRVIPKSRDFH
jgi:error-prone DNA polymerase